MLGNPRAAPRGPGTRLHSHSAPCSADCMAHTAPSPGSPTVTTAPPCLRKGYPALAPSVTMPAPKTEKELSVAGVTHSRVLLQEFLPPSTGSKSIVPQVLFPLHPKLEPPKINSVGKLVSHFNEITANFMYQRTTSWKHAVIHRPPPPDFSQALASSSYFETNVLISVTKPRLISSRENITSSLRCL